MSNEPDYSRQRPGLEHALPWLVGLLAGLLVVGPALKGGSLLSLDLVVTPRIPVPRGVWGLGPELPRRVPFTAPLAWASTVLNGSVVWALVAILAITAAFAGAWNLAAGAPTVTRAGAGLLYALSPFVLTRLGVGHLALVVAVAMLPWALPTLLQPDRDLPRTLLWAAALGCTGAFGGALGLFVVAVGVVASRGRRIGAVAGVYVLGQLLWLVPGAVQLAEPRHLAHASQFATDASGVGGFLRVLAGYGFWQRRLQVGPSPAGAGLWTAFAGLLIAALALIGARDLPAPWGRRAAALAGVGLVLTVASATPGVQTVYSAVVDTRVGATLRESQRFLALYLVWAAPAAALGAARLARARSSVAQGVVWATPLAVAALLAGPGLLGIQGRLEPVALPSEWSRARSAVLQHPGTVLALPWHQYLQMSVAHNRNVFNPIPIYFGGDVLSSSDPEFLADPEQSDPREPTARRILIAIRAGRPVAARLGALGIRWVVLSHDVDWERYRSLAADPGLAHTVAGATLDLWEVRGWRGPLVARSGRTVAQHTLVQPFASADGSGPLTWYRPADPGWMRGWRRSGATSSGLVRLPAGGGLIWYWPAVLVLAGDLTTAAGVVWAVLRQRGRRRPLAPSE